MHVQLRFTNFPLPAVPVLDAQLKPGRLGDALVELVRALPLPGLQHIQSVAFGKTPLAAELKVVQGPSECGIRREGGGFVVGPVPLSAQPPVLQVEGVWDEDAVRRFAVDLRQQQLQEGRKQALAAMKACVETNPAGLIQRYKLGTLHQAVEQLASRKVEARIRLKNCLVFYCCAAQLQRQLDAFVSFHLPSERKDAFIAFVTALEKASGAIQIVHPDDYSAMSDKTALFGQRLRQGKEALRGALKTGSAALVAECMLAHDKSYIVTIGSAAEVMMKASASRLSLTERLEEYAKGESNQNVFTRKMEVAKKLKVQFENHASNPVGSEGYFALWDRIALPIIAVAGVTTLLDALPFIRDHLDEIAAGLAPLPKSYLAAILIEAPRRQREKEEREKQEEEGAVPIVRQGAQLATALGVPTVKAGLQMGQEVRLPDFSTGKEVLVAYKVVHVDSSKENKFFWVYKLQKK